MYSIFKNNLVLSILFIFSTSFISTNTTENFDSSYIDIEYIVLNETTIEVPNYVFLINFDILSKIAFKYLICALSKKNSEAPTYSLITTFFDVLCLNLKYSILIYTVVYL